MVCQQPPFLFCHKKTNVDRKNNSMPANDNDSIIAFISCCHVSTNDNDHEEGWEVHPSSLTLLSMAKKPNQPIAQAHGAHDDGSYCTSATPTCQCC
jgi:hypothetical protein